MNIIGISGYKGSGKDTIADYLVEYHNFTKVSFADPVKGQLCGQYDLPLSYFNDPYLKDSPIKSMPFKTSIELDFCRPIQEVMVNQLKIRGGVLYWTPRALMILEAQTKRAVDPGYWCDALRGYFNYNGIEGNVVVPDIRFENEIEMLRDVGNNSKFIRVSRDSVPVPTDGTETELDSYSFDHYIPNNNTLEDLHKEINNYLGGIR